MKIKHIILLSNILIASALLLTNLAVHAATVIAASVLPVSEYTRITIESDQAIVHSMLILKNPSRVVLDLKNSPINQSLKALANKALPADSYIKQVRVAKFKQGITRIVVDLKTDATPKLSIYKPASGYQHRLALDIYPLQETLNAGDGTQENTALSEARDDAKVSDSNASNSNSSGAKIILETRPALEFDDYESVPIEPN
jgi:N-acetylmuramoyl-L-alanine amidase